MPRRGYHAVTALIRSTTIPNQAFRSIAALLQPVLLPFLVSRGFILVMAVLLQWFISRSKALNLTYMGDAPLSTLSALFDARWYADVAANGYSLSPNTLAEQNYHFFPLLPFLMRFAGDLSGLGGFVGGYNVVGVVLSHLFFLFALALLYKMTVQVWGAAELATDTVWIIVAMPWAAVFSMPYTESLFLFLSVAAILVAHGISDRPRFDLALLSGILAGFATLTRPQGLVVVVPVVWLLAVSPGQLKRRERLRYALLGTLPAVILLVTFVLAVGLRVGNIFAVFQSGRAWGDGWIGSLPLLFSLGPSIPLWYVVLLGALILALWASITAILITRYIALYRARDVVPASAPVKWPALWAFALYACAYLLVTVLFSPNLEGWGRYLLLVFPCVWVVAQQIKSQAWFTRFILIAFGLQAIFYTAAVAIQLSP